MTNALVEFHKLLDILDDGVVLQAADLSYFPVMCDVSIKIRLKEGYDQKELNAFIEKLRFDYDNGFGCQQLIGTVWFTDETWATRGEYDGSEWWEYHRRPEIPRELR